MLNFRLYLCRGRQWQAAERFSSFQLGNTRRDKSQRDNSRFARARL